MREAARIKIVVSALFSSRFGRLLALPSFAPPQNCEVYRIFMGMWPQQICGLNTTFVCRFRPMDRSSILTKPSQSFMITSESIKIR